MTTSPRHYLFALVDGGGTVPPELGTVRRLVERGHRVTVLGDDSMADEVAVTGAAYLPWTEAPNKRGRRAEDAAFRDWECKNPLQLFTMVLDAQFVGPIVLLTSDSVFSGGEAFALAIRQLPYVTIVGDHTNGIFSYQLEKKLPNGWEYCLSYQVYLSADHVCYEGKGVPADIELLNTKADIARGVDPLIARALEVLKG